jgi:hypothetical protein
MKSMLTVGGVVLLAGFLWAQERIEPEIAKKYARVFVEQSASLSGLQLKIDADPERPYGLKHEEVGALIIPDKRLSEAVLQKLGKETAPLAQLWVRNLTIVVNDQLVPNDQLRIVTVSANGKDHPLPLFLLGVRKKTADDLELVVYGPNKEPLVLSPLKKIDGSQDLPIELEGTKRDDGRGTLTLRILGKYQVELTLAKQE